MEKETKMIMSEQNFLPKMFFEKLSKIVNGSQFQWFFNESDLYENAKTPIENFMFTHSLFRNEVASDGTIIQGPSSDWFNIFEPILYFINEKVKVTKLIRMKLNLYTNQKKKIIHLPHCDLYNTETNKPFKDITTTILNFTTCNGGTIINNKEYPSKANELFIFNNTIKHCGIIQTDTQKRIVLNINWR
jgi:hypothetical protein